MNCEECDFCKWVEVKCSTDKGDQVWLEPKCELNQCIKEDKNVK